MPPKLKWVERRSETERPVLSAGCPECLIKITWNPVTELHDVTVSMSDAGRRYNIPRQSLASLKMAKFLAQGVWDTYCSQWGV